MSKTQVLIVGSSAKSVGVVGCGQVAEGVVEGEFVVLVGAEAEGFAKGEFGFGVHALDGPGGVLLAGGEPVEDEGLVVLEHVGERDQGLDPGALDAFAPTCEEVSCLLRRIQGEELPKLLLEEVGPHGVEVVLEDFLEAGDLLC